MRRLVRNVAVVLVGLAACSFAAASALAVEARELAGKYTAKGTDPDGTQYEGTTEITFKKGSTVEIVWKVGRRTTVGIGRLVGDVLTVEYQGAIADREGKASYEVKPRGRLVGKWHTKDVKGVGTETLTPKS